MAESKGILDFKNYIEVNYNEACRKALIKYEQRKQFLEEYPLQKIKELKLEEYCVGTDVSKNSLCYKLEFGKYKAAGFGIGGGSAKKFGIYYNKKEQCYKFGSDRIEDIETFWPRFRNDLYRFLVNSGRLDEPLVLEDYDMLRGMAMVLTKYLCLYFPDKYISMGSHNALKKLMDRFEYAYDDDMRCHQLNYWLNKHLREDIPSLQNVDSEVIGILAFEFIDGKPMSYTSSNKGSGLGDDDVNETRYWMYAPGNNASKWPEYSKAGIMGIGWGEIGDLSEYETRTDMQEKMKEVYASDQPYIMSSLATWQFANEMKPGDIVYAKKGISKLVGRGVVTSDYYYVEDTPDEYKNFRKVNWTHIGNWEAPDKGARKTLTEVTSYTDYVEQLELLFDPEKDDSDGPVQVWNEYSREDFLNQVYIDEEAYDTLVDLILTKKNVILQGAPGVGKTYAANRLAYSILGEKNKDRVMMVQFHQSYSYEDFIEGFRPTSNGQFDIRKGAFYNFCVKARDDADNKYFFIIDEINRGNLSKIFGELFMLIEKDKRGNALQLLYSDEKFYVPSNVYIIGMMNTADRSLAMLDYALRRRFAFFEMKPAFNNQKFIDYRIGLNSAKFNSLIEEVQRLNDHIKEDPSLGEDFCIGHSYFCELKEVTDKTLYNIVEYELIPLLKEYWFDDPAEVRDWSERLRRSIQ